MATDGSRRSKWGALLGIAVATTLALAFAWVAFGPGRRHCSVSLSLPLLGGSRMGGEAICRGAFGFGMLLAMAIVLLCLATAIRPGFPGRIADALQTAGQWMAIAALAPLLLVMLLAATPVWIGKWATGRMLRRRPD